MFKKILLFFLVLIFLAIAYFVLQPSPIDAVAWTPPTMPELIGQYEKNKRLSKVEILFPDQCNRCEDVAIDSIGSIYGGEINGNIVVFENGQRRVLANTGGRPLGLHFDHSQGLIVADADKGLLSIDQSGKITILVDEYQGKKLIFVDDLEIAADSTIYFSDASNKFGFPDNKLDILEGRSNGSLYAYYPQTKKTKKLLDDLYFANGIAVAHDQSYVLVNETSRYRTKRYWLKGPKAGQSDVFIENLPGFPDGISQGNDGIFWLALVSPRKADLDAISSQAFIKNLIAKLPEALQPAAVHYGFVLGVDSKGKVQYNLQDPSGKYAEISSVQQFGDALYLGSLYENGIGMWKIKD